MLALSPLVKTQARGLLRILFLRLGAVPARATTTSGEQGNRIKIKAVPLRFPASLKQHHSKLKLYNLRFFQ